MLRNWLIKKLKGFSSVEEAIDSIEDPKEKNVILTRAVKKLFNTIDADDILQVVQDGQWKLEGKLLPNGTRDLMKEEARNFLQGTLWKTIQADIQYQANHRMFVLGKSEADLVAGKLFLYSLNVIKHRLIRMGKGEGNFEKVK